MSKKPHDSTEFAWDSQTTVTLFEWCSQNHSPRPRRILLYAYQRLLEGEVEDSVLAGMIQAAEEVLRGMGLAIPELKELTPKVEVLSVSSHKFVSNLHISATAVYIRYLYPSFCLALY